MTEDTMETLRCPVCDHRFRRKAHPGAAFCGPHRAADGVLTPAVRMVVEVEVASGTKLPKEKGSET